jgi:hypothetical protein
MKTELIIGAAALALVLGSALAESAKSGAAKTTPAVAVPAVQAAAPAIKPLPLLIPTGNHYVCYPASLPAGFVIPVQNVDLKDQFGMGNARITGITRLCNPVVKTVTDKNGRKTVHDIIDRRLHIVCYAIAYTIKPPARVTVKDQFIGQQELDLKLATELCLPAAKKG